MINKSSLFLLLLLAGGFYFFHKGETTGLIMICLFVIYLSFSGGGNEHAGNVPGETESIQNLASAYANGTLKVTNLEVKNKLTVDGPSQLTGNVTASGNTMTIAGNANISGNLNVVGGIANSGTFRSGSSSSWAAIDAQGNMDTANLTVSGNLTIQPFNGIGGNVYVPIGHSYVVGKGDPSGVGFSSGAGNLSIYRESDGQVLYGSNITGAAAFTPNPFGANVGGWNSYGNGVSRP